MTTKPLPGAMIDYQHPLSRGLVDWWLFNEGAGSQVSSIRHGGNNGTITNVDLASAWTGSPRGRSLRFDGVDDHAVLPNGMLGGLTEWSVTCWINIFSLVNLSSPLFGDLASGNLPALRWESADSKWHWWAHDGAGHICRQEHDTLPVINVWHHLAVTYDSTGPRVSVYTNAVNDTGDEVNASGALATGSAARFGGGGSASAAFFNGLIDDVRTYDRALASEEIQELHAAPYVGIMS